MGMLSVISTVGRSMTKLITNFELGKQGDEDTMLSQHYNEKIDDVDDDETEDGEIEKGSQYYGNSKESKIENQPRIESMKDDQLKGSQNEDETKEVFEKYNNDYIFQAEKVDSEVQNVKVNHENTIKTEIGSYEHEGNISRFMTQEYGSINNFVCDACPNSFRTNRSLRQHQKYVHSLKRDFPCLICSKGCVSKGELVTHMKCHTKERDFKCDVCSDAFITNSCLKAHKRKHDGTMLQCQDCGKQFTKTQHLNVHIKFVHLKASTKLRSERRRELKLRKRDHKSLKDLSLATELYKNNLKYMKEKTGEKSLDRVKEQTDLMCTVCGKLFKKLSKKKIHMLTHTELFKNFNIDSNVIWSEDETTMSCKDCGKKFIQKGHMKVHIALVHHQLQNQENLGNSNKSYMSKRVVTMKAANGKTREQDHNKVECQECGKKYYTRHLKEHISNVHLRKSDIQTDVTQPEDEFLHFLTKLNMVLSGPELVLVLRYVQNSKESSNTEELRELMEDSQNRGYRRILEELGVLHPKIGHDTHKEILTGTKRRQREKVTKQEYSEHDNEFNIVIDGLPTYSMEEQESQWFTDEEKSEQGTEEKMFKKTIRKIVSNKKGKKQNETEEKGPSKVIAKESKTCSICSKHFAKVSKKKYHMLIHTKLFKNLGIDDKINRSEDRTLLSCRECGKEFNQFSHMKMHIARVHYQLHRLENLNNLDSVEFLETVEKSCNDKKNTSQSVKKEEMFYCEFCFEEFSHSGDLKKHKRNKHERLFYKCEICEYSTSTNPKLSKHKTSKHSVKSETIKGKEGPHSKPEEPIFCELCMKNFARKEGLARHKYFKHEGLGHNCDKCDYAARTPLGLLKHKSSKHGINFELIPDDVVSSSSRCKECGKLYNDKTGLRRHEMVHTGERPFPCMKCDKKFRQKSTLDGHQRIHN